MNEIKLTKGMKLTLGSAVIVVPFLTYVYSNIDTVHTWVKITAIAMVAAFFIFLLFDKYAFKLFNFVKFKFQRIYSPYIYEYISGHVEYLRSDGSLASTYREDHITRLSFKRSEKKKDLHIEIGEGTILSESANGVNCSMQQINDTHVKFVCELSKKDVVDKVHISGYAALLENALLDNPDFWIIAVDAYCKRLNYNFIFPENRKTTLIEVHSRRKLEDEEIPQNIKVKDHGKFTDWKIDNNTPRLKKIQNGREVFTIFLNKVSTQEQYKVSWTLED